MEDSLDRLRCLDYQTYFVKKLRQKVFFGRHHFCIPTENTAIQFNQYIELIKWLSSVILYTPNSSTNDGGDSEFYETNELVESIDPCEDPNLVAQKMLHLLRKLDFEIDFPVSNLKQPYGAIAVSILDHLTIKAVQAKGIVLQQPTKYNAGGTTYGNTNNNSDELEEDIEMIFYDEESTSTTTSLDENIGDVRIRNKNDYDMDGESEKVVDDDDMKHIIKSKIDPIQWKIELERVSPSLQGEILIIESFFQRSIFHEVKFNVFLYVDEYY